MDIDYNYDWHTFPNIGYVTKKFTNEELKPIRDEVDKIYLKNFVDQPEMNSDLIGHVDKEFRLLECTQYANDLIIPYCQGLEKEFDYTRTHNVIKFGQKISVYLDSLWVNFQKKHEYNPIHEHGGLFSFVIWLNIPYTIEEEKKEFGKLKEGTNQAGCFNFHYINTIGKVSTTTLPVDKTWENTMAVFPSNLHHSVNPFQTSDEYRITVSGNFQYKVVDM